MEEDNRKYTLIYDIYKMHEEAVKEWSMVPWSKLDSSVLEVGANKHEKEVKVLASKKLPNADTYPPFVKLKAKITGFKNSLPLIQELKHPAVQERHWKRIMEESGRDLGDINLKTITLAKVFEMNLHEVSEKVTEICNEAKEEAKNEENIAKIDALWKNTNFTVKDYKKKSYAITATDEIR